MPFLKKLFYYGLLAVLTLLAIEGMARLAYFTAFAEGYDRGAPAVAAADSTRPLIELTRNDAATRLAIAHPWYGYSLGNTGYPLNTVLPSPRQGDTVTIALLGGSVAFENAAALHRALYHHFTVNNLPRRPVLLNLSTSGARQPYQANAAAHHLLLGRQFDIIVNLDALNEATFTDLNIESGIFPQYPLRVWSIRVRSFNAAVHTLVGRIALLRADQERRQQAAAAHPLRYTALYGLIHRYQVERTGQRIIQLNHDLAATRAAYSLEADGPRSDLRSAADWQREDARIWYRGSLLLRELAELSGAEYYQFLQPNQYLPDSKPLTNEELECCWQPDDAYGQNYRAIHPRLVQLGAKLQQQSVHFFDLSLIFQDNRETLYRDECCHFNGRGNELLAAAIVERMAPGLRRAAMAERPALALDAAAARPQSEQLLLDADFRVYRRGRYWLVYSKEDCAPRDRETPFFLHIIPANGADLPADRREHGFDNWDFRFEHGGGVINGRCVVERRLPNYAIASIRTGQYVEGGGKLWEGEYRFEE